MFSLIEVMETLTDSIIQNFTEHVHLILLSSFPNNKHHKVNSSLISPTGPTISPTRKFPDLDASKNDKNRPTKTSVA
jgi:uncharacterized protein YggT (Ycf19 family)